MEYRLFGNENKREDHKVVESMRKHCLRSIKQNIAWVSIVNSRENWNTASKSPVAEAAVRIRATSMLASTNNREDMCSESNCCTRDGSDDHDANDSTWFGAENVWIEEKISNKVWQKIVMLLTVVLSTVQYKLIIVIVSIGEIYWGVQIVCNKGLVINKKAIYLFMHLSIYIDRYRDKDIDIYVKALHMGWAVLYVSVIIQ